MVIRDSDSLETLRLASFYERASPRASSLFILIGPSGKVRSNPTMIAGSMTLEIGLVPLSTWVMPLLKIHCLGQSVEINTANSSAIYSELKHNIEEPTLKNFAASEVRAIAFQNRVSSWACRKFLGVNRTVILTGDFAS